MNKYKDLTELQRKMVAILLKVNGKDKEAEYVELCRQENKKESEHENEI